MRYRRPLQEIVPYGALNNLELLFIRTVVGSSEGIVLTIDLETCIRMEVDHWPRCVFVLGPPI